MGVPAVDAFPVATWHRCLLKRSRRATRAELSYGDAAGYKPLRRAVASYLAASRGVRCDPEQVLIMTSSQQALDVALRVLMDPGEVACIEEPGYLGVRGAMAAAGVRVQPVAVDEGGVRVRELDPRARLVYVTPSHQYPLGATLGLERRLALLRWAESANRWILEDDYDSEFRYVGRPLSALQGLDASHRVVYFGTFTKVLFPSLRLAYAVVPPDLVDPFVAARRLIDGHSSTLEQAVLADFIDAGHFASHIRRMRELYRERQEAFVDAAAKELGERLRVSSSEAGMHLTGFLSDGLDDRDVVRRAAELGVEANALSRYYAARPMAAGLVMGYACIDVMAIRRGVAVLARSVERADAAAR